MRLLCLADLHYTGDRRLLGEVVERVEEDVPDVVVVAGDVSGYGSLAHVREALEALRDAADPAPVLVVLGNHDVWVSRGEAERGINLLLKLSMFNELCSRLGCTPLMRGPLILGDVGFTGSISWYDYSFTPDWLGLSLDEHRGKAYGIYTWMDREYVRLPLSDEEFTLSLLEMGLLLSVHGLRGPRLPGRALQGQGGPDSLRAPARRREEPGDLQGGQRPENL